MTAEYQVVRQGILSQRSGQRKGASQLISLLLRRIVVGELFSLRLVGRTQKVDCLARHSASKTTPPQLTTTFEHQTVGSLF
jgi:hypothetical protein